MSIGQHQGTATAATRTRKCCRSNESGFLRLSSGSNTAIWQPSRRGEWRINGTISLLKPFTSFPEWLLPSRTFPLHACRTASLAGTQTERAARNQGASAGHARGTAVGQAAFKPLPLC
jgi:hypothetical protein